MFVCSFFLATTAERKESGSCLPEELGLGEQLLSTAGCGGELKVRAFLLGVFILGLHQVTADDKHMFKSTSAKQFRDLKVAVEMQGGIFLTLSFLLVSGREKALETDSSGGGMSSSGVVILGF